MQEKTLQIIIWQSPETVYPVSKDGKLHQHCAKDRKLSTGIQPYCTELGVLWRESYYLQELLVIIPTLQTTIWRRNLISERTHLLLLLVLTKSLKTSAAAKLCCKHNVPRKMIWQASIDRFLQLLWNQLFKIISSNCKVKQFYWQTTGFWTQISLAHRRQWNMFPCYSETERCQPSPLRERQMSHLFPRYSVQSLSLLAPLLYIHSLSSSLDQLKSSQVEISCAHTNCSSLTEGRQASKLCRRDDANIAVQSLFLNRLIVLLPEARTLQNRPQTEKEF